MITASELMRDYALTESQSIRLANIMRLSSRGTSRDLVSPLIPRDDPKYGREILIKELETAIHTTGYEWLDEVEELQREKIGPYSIMLPFSERIDGVMSYFKTKHFDPDVTSLDLATENVVSRLPFNRLQLASLDAAFNVMPRNTNLGMPWVSKDSANYPSMKAKAENVLSSGYNVWYYDPAILFWRGQPRGMDLTPKQRVVWGFPHDVTLLEEMIQLPLLDALSIQESFSAWVGTDAVNHAVTSVIDNAHLELLSVDFSGFDASISADLIRRAFHCIRSWFHYDAARHIDYVQEKFLQIGLLTPIGLINRVDGSVPSGSGLTNMIDSIVQLIAFEYCAIRMDNRVVNHIVQGDDGVIQFATPWELDQVTEVISELGLSVSSDKGGVSKDQVYYLQNVHSNSYRIGGVCVGVRPLMRILNGMMSYERLHNVGLWNAYMDTLRWYQQAESGRYHPKFSYLVDLLYRRDRISRQFGPREIIARAGGLETVKSLLNEHSFPYGKESLSGLMRFEVVRQLGMLKARGRIK